MDSVARISDLFEHRWRPFILLSLADGPQAFSAIAAQIRRQISGRAADSPASRRRLDDSVLSRNLVALRKLGYVERVPHEEDRAGERWALTAKAGPTIAVLRRIIKVLDETHPEESTSDADDAVSAVRATGVGPVPDNGVRPAVSASVRPDWVPPVVDIERPSVARIYDYFLGGSHNFAADRVQAELALKADPDVAWKARVGRAFLGRAVRYLLDAGVRQFLDIGSGIPTVGNVHEIIQRMNVDARVVYVDIDAIAVAHTRRILGSNRRATILHADARRPEAILSEATSLLDFAEPVGLLLLGILHAIPDEDRPRAVVDRLRQGLAPGSYLAISHATADSMPTIMRKAEQLSRKTTTPVTMRSRSEVMAFFAGMELVDPGLVWAPEWRPDPDADREPDPQRSCNYVGVARIPAAPLDPP